MKSFEYSDLIVFFTHQLRPTAPLMLSHLSQIEGPLLHLSDNPDALAISHMR